MRAVINKSQALGVVNAPPSKSYAHRLLIVAALSKGKSEINNITLSNDILATINCLRTLRKIVIIKDSSIIVNNDNNEILDDTLIFDCNESGSTLRFFIPIALTTGKKVIFKGTKRLIERGIGPYEEICAKQNIKVEKHDTHIIFEGKLKSSTFNVPGNISSQFISGLLFALPLLDGDNKIIITTPIESKNYIDITIDTLSKSGIRINYENNIIEIPGNQRFTNQDYTVEGDYSNSAFLDVYNYLNGNVTVNNLNPNSLQGDKLYKKYFDLLSKENSIIDLSNSIDLGPIMFAFASLKYGGHFIGTSRLKIKESDRIQDMAKELRKFGVHVTEGDNEVFIENTNIHSPNEDLDGHNDHRIVMSLVVIASIYGGIITGCEAVNKSFPDFFEKIKSLGIEVELYD